MKNCFGIISFKLSGADSVFGPHGRSISYPVFDISLAEITRIMLCHSVEGHTDVEYTSYEEDPFQMKLHVEGNAVSGNFYSKTQL